MWGICFKIRIMPIAASSPLMTLEGKKAEILPILAIPKRIWKTPAKTTAIKKDSKDPSIASCPATTAVRPAAGPLTLVCEPLKTPTIIPPTIPETNPEKRGAPEARAMPKQRGTATKNTTRPADKSFKKKEGEYDSPFKSRDFAIVPYK